MRRAVSRAPSTFGGSAASIRRQVLALVMMPDSGWLTSCAIDAVSAPRLVTLATCASSDRALPSASSESRRCRHVLNRADVLQLTILVPGRMSDHVQVLDRVVGHLQPVLVFKVAAVASRPVDHVIQQLDVFRMDSSTDQLERHGHSRSNSKMR